MRYLMLMAVLAILVACSKPELREDVVPVLPVNDLYPYGPDTLGKRIADAKIIVRGILDRVEAASIPLSGGPDHLSVLRFTFDVHEYLKGTGGNQVTALAYKYDYGVDERPLVGAASASEAVAKAAELLEYRDKRWDDHEGIVFLNRNTKLGDPQHFWLGPLKVTVASESSQSWLPAAHPDGGSGGATSRQAQGSAQGQLFLMEDPTPNLVETFDQATQTITLAPARAHTAAQMQTITLEHMKQQISAVSAEIAAGDGSEAFRYCVAAKYEGDAVIAHYRVNNPELFSIRVHDPSEYGANATTTSTDIAARTVLYNVPYANENEPYDREWLEGEHSHLLGVDAPGAIYALRPLPAGKYRVFFNHQNHIYFPCNYYPEIARNRVIIELGVTAPAGTLAESFFDPYASSTAVVGATTVGTISWQSGRVTADLTRSVTGHVLDFIDLKGATTLSLIVADATEDDAGALTWTAPTQPWRAGDKLMLRVRKNGAP